MRSIMDLLHKYKSLVSYIFFGVCTTAVNVVVYDICYNRLKTINIIATIIACVAAVLFAFITNKLFVFDSKSFEWKKLQYEMITFLTCRLLTGVLDVAIMFIAVDIMQLNGIIWKIVSNIIVIILNYIASRLVIFKQTK